MSIKNKTIVFNGEVITKETIDATLAHYIEENIEAIKSVKDSCIDQDRHDSYIKERYAELERLKSGKWDLSPAFLNVAYGIQTGKFI